MVFKIVGSATVTLVHYPAVGVSPLQFAGFLRLKKMSIWLTAGTRETDKQGD